MELLHRCAGCKEYLHFVCATCRDDTEDAIYCCRCGTDGDAIQDDDSKTLTLEITSVASNFSFTSSRVADAFVLESDDDSEDDERGGSASTKRKKKKKDKGQTRGK